MGHIKVMVLLALVQMGLGMSGKCKIRLDKVKAQARCEPPWLAWGDHCYLTRRGERGLNFSEDRCQELSELGRPSHLASVTSREENQFIKAYADASGLGYFWIGFKKNAAGVYVWTDGTDAGSFKYRGWGENQPLLEHDCAHVYSGQWGSQWCTNPRDFVCKMKMAQVNSNNNSSL